MSVIKSFSVGNGDMFYIKHNSDNFTIIDCNLIDDVKEDILDEIDAQRDTKGIERFIRTVSKVLILISNQVLSLKILYL